MKVHVGLVGCIIAGILLGQVLQWATTRTAKVRESEILAAGLKLGNGKSMRQMIAEEEATRR